ncbi:MAG: RNA polymerase sigma factor [Deltaproteobacteria bacterium]|nr:RNA polymerase sigma factor [Deltaproteobacteria bacterium]
MENQLFIEALKRSDSKTVEELLKIYTPILYNYGMRFIANKEEIPDLISDTFEACLKSIEKFQGKSTFKTWLIQIFRHKAYDLFKTQKYETPLEEELLELNHLFNEKDAWNDEVSDWGKNPETLLIQKEIFSQLNEAIHNLPSPYGEAVYLKDIEELKIKEISNILQVSETHLRVILHRGRLKLKMALDSFFKTKK